MTPRPYPKRVVLHCSRGDGPQVEELAAQFIQDGVMFVGVVGPECERVEYSIDRVCVGDGTLEPYFEDLTIVAYTTLGGMPNRREKTLIFPCRRVPNFAFRIRDPMRGYGQGS